MNKKITEAITILNIILFLYTGIDKILDYSIFKEQLLNSPILSWAAQPIALILPWVEFAIVIMLIIPRWRLNGLYTSFIIMISFTAYIIVLFSISPKMPCSCGGIIELLSWQQHLIFNGAMILLDVLAIYLTKNEKKHIGKSWNNNKTEYSISHP